VDEAAVAPTTLRARAESIVAEMDTNEDHNVSGGVYYDPASLPLSNFTVNFYCVVAHTAHVSLDEFVRACAADEALRQFLMPQF
jgi:hypothetical protein